MKTLLTGGCGYIGALLARELRAGGREVNVLDCLLHGQSEIAAALTDASVEVIRGDIRDPEARGRALEGVDAVVHLAAIVGDPACALDPDLAAQVNVTATRELIRDCAQRGVGRFVFASTCSNYGRTADPEVAISEEGELRPVSLYAEQKVQIERLLLDGGSGLQTPVCLRFATVYGVAPRMRFDLTVNEFTRDLWDGRELEVFGEQFWRPYIHVADAARAVRAVLEAPAVQVAGEVFNVGDTAENYRKLDLVGKISEQIDRATVSYVSREEDPRDYKVNFQKIRSTLGFQTQMSVPDGITEVIAALDAGVFGDPFDGRYRNIP